MKRSFGMDPPKAKSLCESAVKDELLERGVLSCERGAKTLFVNENALSARACGHPQVRFISDLGLVNCRESDEKRDVTMSPQDIRAAQQVDEQYAQLFMRALEIRAELSHAPHPATQRSIPDSRERNAEGSLKRNCSTRSVRGLLAMAAGEC